MNLKVIDVRQTHTSIVQSVLMSQLFVNSIYGKSCEKKTSSKLLNPKHIDRGLLL